MRSEFFKEKAKLERLMKKRSKCFFKDLTGERCRKFAIKKSHSLQKKGPLRAIADKNHDVVWANDQKLAIPGSSFFRTIRIGTASTFPGFCERHDNEIFESIEQNSAENLTEIDMLKIAYRSTCFELNSIILLRRVFEEIKNSEHFPQLSRFYADPQRQDYAEETKLALRDISLAKRDLETAFQAPIQSGARTIFFEFEKQLPFCYSISFCPSYDLFGRYLNPNVGEIWNRIGAFAGSIFGRNYLILSGVQRNESHETDELFRQLLGSEDDTPLLYAYFLSYYWLKNTYFSVQHYLDNLEFFKSLEIRLKSISPAPAANPIYSFQSRVQRGFPVRKNSIIHQGAYSL